MRMGVLWQRTKHLPHFPAHPLGVLDAPVLGASAGRGRCFSFFLDRLLMVRDWWAAAQRGAQSAAPRLG